MADSPAKYNAAVELWIQKATVFMLRKIQSEGLARSGNLFKKVSWHTKKRSGNEIERISWKAPRYGFVLAHVGKKFVYEKKRKVVQFQTRAGHLRPKKFQRYSKDTRVLARQGAEADWIFSVLEKEVPSLADIVSELRANRAINASAIISTASNLRRK